MAAVLQYVCSEVLELAGEICQQKKKKTISPQHLQIAARGDEELMKLLSTAMISSGGTIPFVHAALFPGKKGVTEGHAVSAQPTQTL